MDHCLVRLLTLVVATQTNQLRLVLLKALADSSVGGRDHLVAIPELTMSIDRPQPCGGPCQPHEAIIKLTRGFRVVSSRARI